MPMQIVIISNGTYNRKKDTNRLIRYHWLTMCSCSVLNSIVGSFCNLLKILNGILWTTIWSKDFNTDQIFGCWKTQYQISWKGFFFVYREMIMYRLALIKVREKTKYAIVCYQAFLLWASMKFWMSHIYHFFAYLLSIDLWNHSTSNSKCAFMC